MKYLGGLVLLIYGIVLFSGYEPFASARRPPLGQSLRWSGSSGGFGGFGTGYGTGYGGGYGGYRGGK